MQVLNGANVCISAAQVIVNQQQGCPIFLFLFFRTIASPENTLKKLDCMKYLILVNIKIFIRTDCKPKKYEIPISKQIKFAEISLLIN